MEVDNQSEPVAVNTTPIPKPKNNKSNFMMVVIAVLLLAAGGAAGYFWRDKTAKDQSKTDQSEISQLQAQITTLEKDVADAKAATAAAKAKTTAVPTSVSPSATVLASIKDSITSGNTAALDGYMATSVNVILAASEAYGPQTPTQAIADLQQQIIDKDKATNPWNFALPTATMTDYQTGDYKQYFPSTALVGKSKNGYVVSFQFNSSAKISGIFMSAPEIL